MTLKPTNKKQTYPDFNETRIDFLNTLITTKDEIIERYVELIKEKDEIIKKYIKIIEEDEKLISKLLEGKKGIIKC